jgi:N-acetylmuramoyl-L-alanine amidase
MSKVFLNPGHKINLDSGAVNPYTGLQEAEVVMNVGQLVKGYLEAVGYEVELLQSNSLNGEDADWDNPSICATANASGADVFVSIHCNAYNGVAQGTEVEVYSYSSIEANKLGQAIQDQIVDTFDTVDRGLKERPNLSVLRNTDMPAVLVELAFIDNDEDAQLLANDQDGFARAVARGISDYFAM